MTEIEGSIKNTNSFCEMKEKIYKEQLEKELKETILEENPLKEAIEKNKILAIQYYIENAPEEILHYDSNYVLKWAVKYNKLNIIKLLHAKGFNIEECDIKDIIINSFFNMNLFNYCWENITDNNIKHEFLKEAIYKDDKEITIFILETFKKENEANKNIKPIKINELVKSCNYNLIKIVFSYNLPMEKINVRILFSVIRSRKSDLLKLLFDNNLNCTPVIKNILKEINGWYEYSFKNDKIVNLVLDNYKKHNKKPLIVNYDEFSREMVSLLKSSKVTMDINNGKKCVIM